MCFLLFVYMFLLTLCSDLSILFSTLTSRFSLSFLPFLLFSLCLLHLALPSLSLCSLLLHVVNFLFTAFSTSLLFLPFLLFSFFPLPPLSPSSCYSKVRQTFLWKMKKSWRHVTTLSDITTPSWPSAWSRRWFFRPLQLSSQIQTLMGSPSCCNTRRWEHSYKIRVFPAGIF